MNKKLLGIIGIICVIAIIVIVCVVIKKQDSTQAETGAFNKMTITTKGYAIDINSKEVGHPSSGSLFSTSFDIVNKDKSSKTYFVNYAELKLASDSTFNDEIINDVAEQGEVTINGKKFNYSIGLSPSNAALYYQIPDGNGKLIITVKGGNVFDSEGNQAKTQASVDEEVLNSKELAGILNFSVSKEQ